MMPQSLADVVYHKPHQGWFPVALMASWAQSEFPEVFEIVVSKVGPRPETSLKQGRPEARLRPDRGYYCAWCSQVPHRPSCPCLYCFLRYQLLQAEQCRLRSS